MMADNGHAHESQGTFPKGDFVSSLDYGRSRVADRADFGGGGGNGETRGVLLDAFSAPPNTYLEHGCFNHPSDVKLPGDSFLEPWMARLAESQLQQHVSRKHASEHLNNLTPVELAKLETESLCREIFLSGVKLGTGVAFQGNLGREILASQLTTRLRSNSLFGVGGSAAVSRGTLRSNPHMDNSASFRFQSTRNGADKQRMKDQYGQFPYTNATPAAMFLDELHENKDTVLIKDKGFSPRQQPKTGEGQLKAIQEERLREGQSADSKRLGMVNLSQKMNFTPLHDHSHYNHVPYTNAASMGMFLDEFREKKDTALIKDKRFSPSQQQTVEEDQLSAIQEEHVHKDYHSAESKYLGKNHKSNLSQKKNVSGMQNHNCYSNIPYTNSATVIKFLDELREKKNTPLTEDSAFSLSQQQTVVEQEQLRSIQEECFREDCHSASSKHLANEHMTNFSLKRKFTGLHCDFPKKPSFLMKDDLCRVGTKHKRKSQNMPQPHAEGELRILREENLIGYNDIQDHNNPIRDGNDQLSEARHSNYQGCILPTINNSLAMSFTDMKNEKCGLMNKRQAGVRTQPELKKSPQSKIFEGDVTQLHGNEIVQSPKTKNPTDIHNQHMSCQSISMEKPPAEKDGSQGRLLGSGAECAPAELQIGKDGRFKAFHKEKWDYRLADLLAYRKKNGHCLVPHTYPPDPQLARWVKRQRRQYKLMQEGKPSTMTLDRVELLEKSGFVWDSHDVSWKEKIEDLRKFRAEHSNCLVPSNYRKDVGLAVW